MGKLSSKGFWGVTAVAFVILLLLHRHYYVMPDAISMAAGSIIGTYFFSGLVWRIVKWRMRDRAPDSRYFIVALSCATLLATNLSRIAGLFK
jgi:uncharacterized membrane protein YccC